MGPPFPVWLPRFGHIFEFVSLTGLEHATNCSESINDEPPDNAHNC